MSSRKDRHPKLELSRAELEGLVKRLPDEIARMQSLLNAARRQLRKCKVSVGGK